MTKRMGKYQKEARVPSENYRYPMKRMGSGSDDGAIGWPEPR